MLEKNMLVKVTNRDSGRVGYSVPDLGITRSFMPGEMKEVSFEEIQKLSWQPGGEYIIKNCLKIDNIEAVNELVPNAEPEYFYSEEDIKKLLLEGTLEQLQDCLDFAPEGVVELVKDLAIKMKLNDVAKREAIHARTGLDITMAININKETEENEEQQEKTRRTQPIAAANQAKDESKERRTAAPQKYNVVTK